MDPDNLYTLLQNVIQQEHTRQVQIKRDTLRDLIRQTSVCDGTNTAAVRLWIHEITLAFKHVGTQYIIQIVTNTVSSHLRFEVERFIVEKVHCMGRRQPPRLYPRSASKHGRDRWTAPISTILNNSCVFETLAHVLIRRDAEFVQPAHVFERTTRWLPFLSRISMNYQNRIHTL